MVCHCTKNINLNAMKTQTAWEVAKHLFNLVCRHSCPKRILTDRGKCFEAELSQGLLSLQDIAKSRTTPYHRQADGLKWCIKGESNEKNFWLWLAKVTSSVRSSCMTGTWVAKHSSGETSTKQSRESFIKKWISQEHKQASTRLSTSTKLQKTSKKRRTIEKTSL